MPRSLFAAVVISLAACGVAAAAESIALFNGQDLTGWTCDLSEEGVGLDDLWSVENGVLRCSGAVPGVLRTEREDFADYRLSLQWRWPAEPGNNGGSFVRRARSFGLS